MKRFILRNSKRIVSGLFFVLLLLVCVLFSHDRITAASRGGYEILSYDCHYKVGEENVYHVTETIVVNFLEYRHGIYRYIPEVNYIRRLDGSTDTIIDSIDVTSCSDEYEDYREGDSRMLKLGDPDEEIIGTHVYVINYDVHWGNDRLEGADEFYMNLVGDGWDVEIPNFTFTI
ncbi:MAG: DUF2207 domain-containing protein, partial [Eubacterium sp.]|nr:DUF2207 domain-containing protein [Eubacterium sp.]